MIPLDLTKQTRPGCQVIIEVADQNSKMVRWITCGQIEINSPNSMGFRTVGARLCDGITDFEHDSAWAFSFNVIALQFEFLRSGRMHFSGFIAPYSQGDSEIRMPQTAKELVADLSECQVCRERNEDTHMMTGTYIPAPRPPGDFRDLYGRRVEICIYMGQDRSK